MKKLLFAFLAMTLFACSSDDSAPVNPNNENPENPENPNPVQECDKVYTGDLILQTQADVNAYAGYCKIDGDLYIGVLPDTDIIDLSPLQTLQEVKGTLLIDSTEIQSLHGLENLKTVYGLKISYNNNLTSLDKLSSFEGIDPENEEGGGVEISSNSALANLKGLEHLTVVYRLWISSGTMIDLSGLEGLKEVKMLYIGRNNALKTLHGLENLKTIGLLELDGNSNLESLSVFSTILSINSIYIKSSPKIINLIGFEGLTKLQSLLIADNPLLDSLNGLQNLKTVNTLHINNCPQLTSLSTLAGITSFSTQTADGFNHAPQFGLYSMQGLTSLDGLQNVTAFTGGEMKIKECFALSNYCAIQDLATQNNFTFVCDSNAFNPNIYDLINGNCSQ